jgi:vitamin B12 transporter
MKIRRFLLISLVFAAVEDHAHASPVLLVSADRLESGTPRAHGQRTVLTRADILERKRPTIDSLLSTLPGLQVTPSGPRGGQSSVFLRGHDARHVMVVIDGVIVNDASNPSNQFDFGHLGVHEIEQIEIIQGPQTLLYGPGALAGIISITTNRAYNQEAKGELLVYGGSYKERGATIHHREASWHLSASYQGSEGFSAAEQGINGVTTPDGREYFSFRGNRSLSLNPIGEVRLSFGVLQDKTEIDGFDTQGKPIDRPDDESTQSELLFSIHQKKDWIAHFWQQELFISRSQNRRKTIQNERPSKFSSTRHQAQLTNQLYLSDQWRLDFGADFRHEEAQFSNNVRQKSLGPFTSARFDHSDFFVQAGARLSFEDYEDTFLSEQLVFGFYLPYATVTLSHGQGYQAPSLFQRFDPSYGSPSLVREQSMVQDLSVVTRNLDKTQARVTAYRSKINDRFDFDPVTFRTINAGKALIKGLELEVTQRLNDQMNLTLAHQALSPIDQKSNQVLPRRARHLWQGELQYLLTEQWVINLDTQYVGSRVDQDRARLSSYQVWGLRGSYRFKDNFGESWISLENVLGKDFQVVPGLQMPGRTFQVGMVVRY